MSRGPSSSRPPPQPQLLRRMTPAHDSSLQQLPSAAQELAGPLITIQQTAGGIELRMAQPRHPGLRIDPVELGHRQAPLRIALRTTPSLLVSALSTDVIAHYLSGLDERGLKGSSRHRKVAAIKTFLRYLEREGAVRQDFSARISGPGCRATSPGRSTSVSTRRCCGRPA